MNPRVLRCTASARRGAAALMLLFVLIPLAGLTLSFLQVGLSFTREQSYRVEDERALLLADAGTEEALVALRMGDTGAVGRSDSPAYLGDGMLWVESFDDVGNDLLRLRSAALVGNGRAALERIVFHWYDEPFTIGIFSSKTLVLASNTMIDSFDSALGSYADQLAAAGGSSLGAGAVAQSNGDVVIGSTVEVYGDAHPGADDTVDIPGSSLVSGSIQPAPEPRELPPIDVPVIPVGGNLSVPGDGILTLVPGDYHFSDLTIGSNTLTIQGPARIVLDDFHMLSNSSLVFDTVGGPVEVYALGDFVVASNTFMDTTVKEAARVSLNFAGGPGQYVDLRSNASFYGTIYAPDGTVEISSNFEVFGSVVADEVILDSNVNIHFDEALLGIPSGPGNFLPATWSLVEFPVKAARADRRDPFELLGFDRNALPMPGDAHDI